MVILAIGLVVTGLALVSALLHTNRLQDQLNIATNELEMAKSFRLLVRAPPPRCLACATGRTRRFIISREGKTMPLNRA